MKRLKRHRLYILIFLLLASITVGLGLSCWLLGRAMGEAPVILDVPAGSIDTFAESSSATGRP